MDDFKPVHDLHKARKPLGCKRLVCRPALTQMCTNYIPPLRRRYSPELQKWMELGNSGMFRPEMLLPMGIPEDVRVIAFGLGLER